MLSFAQRVYIFGCFTDSMRYNTIQSFNVDGKAKCSQLSLAHLTEIAICRYICYSSVDQSRGVLVMHSLSSVKRTMKALLKRRQWPAFLDIFVAVTRRFSPVSPKPDSPNLRKVHSTCSCSCFMEKYRTPYHSSITFVVRTFRYCNSDPSQHS